MAVAREVEKYVASSHNIGLISCPYTPKVTPESFSTDGYFF